MVNAGTLTYILVFIALPALILAAMIPLGEYHLYLTLIALSLFGIGVVIGPAFLWREVH